MPAQGERSNSGKRILVIAPRMLTPDLDTGSLRMYHLAKVLNDLSCQVTFVASFLHSWPPFEDRLEEDSNRLRELGIEVRSPGHTKSVEDLLEESGKTYEVVILSDVYVAAKHMDSVRKYAPQTVILFDTVSLHYLRHYREAKLTGNVRTLKRALKTKRQELAAAEQADYTLVVSPIEKSILEKNRHGLRVHVIPSIHAVYGSAKPFSERKDILFVGSFQHLPNIDAVNYLIEEVYPLVKREVPGVKTYIIGQDPPASVKSMSSSEVIVTDYVPDLAPYFNNCRLSVAPIRFGAGIKGKVLMSMSYGVPVVGSSLATEGMHLTNGKNVLVADNPEDFCDAVVNLYQNETLWDQISESGLAIISQHFSFATVRAKVNELLRNIEKGS